MAKIQQTVSFTHQEIVDLMLKAGKEHLSSQISKDPTGSSRCEIVQVDDDKATKMGNLAATIIFECNGKR